MARVTFSVPTIDCENCARSIRRGLSHVPGVQQVDVDVPNQSVVVVYESAQTTAEAVGERLEQIGFSPAGDSEESIAAPAAVPEPVPVSGRRGEDRALWFTLLGVGVALLALAGYVGYVLYPRFGLPAVEGAGIAVERARLAEASARLARAEDRTRIARDIHDTLAQGLTAIGLDVEGALRHLEGDPERARERLERALATTLQSLEEARRSGLDLRAAPLASQPLADALAALGRAFTSETGVWVHVQADGEITLPLRVEVELYRIAQEALANVRQHAQAMKVEISLRASQSEVVLAIRDDGVGFEPGRNVVDRHGILGMRERAKLVGGQLRIASRPSRGTRISTRVPIEREVTT